MINLICNGSSADGGGGGLVSTLIMFGAIFLNFLFYDNQTAAETSKRKRKNAFKSSKRR